MSTKTSNFEYTKPGVDEFYDVTEYNQTLDQIDADIQARKEAEELKAASGVYGHVKLSDSSAVTDSTGLALPATEKNASIDGTLANKIENFSSKIDLLWSNNGSNFDKTEGSLTPQCPVIVTGTDNELYDAFIIMHSHGQLTGVRNYDGSTCYLTQFLNINSIENNIYIAKREVKVQRSASTSNGHSLYKSEIFIYGCQYRSVTTGSSLQIGNTNCIPYKIYGIRK